MAAFEVIALDTATPQLRAPGASDTYTFPRAVEMPLGTANGVLYLDGSKVVTSGSALTFDGTTFGIGVNTLFDNAKELRWKNASGVARPVLQIYSDNNLYLDSEDGAQIYRTAGTERMRLDSSGNLGLGVTPSAWGSSERALQIGNTLSLVRGSSSEAVLAYNAFVNSSGSYIYNITTNASRYEQLAGQHQWFTAASGTAGDPISFTQALTLDANRNLLLNGTSAGASAVGTLAIFNGTAPTGSVTDGVILYAEDVSSSSELKVRDEAGNVTTLSPHNFSLIPEGPSEEMAWAYYSEKNGKRINVDMLKLARMVEKLTGEQLVYSA